MKNRWKPTIRILALLIALASLPWKVAAQKPADSTEDPAELTFEQNLALPEIPRKRQAAVANYMGDEARKLVRKGYNVATERKGEVIVVTLPVADVFEPNDSVITSMGRQKLEPLMSYLRIQNGFKMLLAIHTDNTGSPAYRRNLSIKRIEALEKFVAATATFPNQAVGYIMEDQEPLKPNDSRKHRERNRRIEIFIVPDQELLSGLK